LWARISTTRRILQFYIIENYNESLIF